MNKTQFYLSECREAASKSPMCFKLGAILVKGGKIISTGYNHHRPHYDGSEVHKRGHRKPVSMHAEMHAIVNITGMSPSFKKQVQGVERRFSRRGDDDPDIPFDPPIPKGSAALERRLSRAGVEQAYISVCDESEVSEGETSSFSEAEVDNEEDSQESQHQWGGRKWSREQWI